MFGQGGAAFDPVAVVAVQRAADVAHFGTVDVAADDALQAALTGHLVISTIHSGTSTGVFARLVNMAIEPFLLASSITGVMGLRLIRRNCAACMQPYHPEPGILKHLTPDEIENGF